MKLKNPRTGYVHSITLILQIAVELNLKAGDRVTERRTPDGVVLTPVGGTPAPAGGGSPAGGGPGQGLGQQNPGGNPQTPGGPGGGTTQPPAGSGGTGAGPPGSPSNPLKTGIRNDPTAPPQGRPLDWLKDAANAVAGSTPDGAERLRQARLFTDEMRKAAEQGLQEASKISDMLKPKTPVDFLLLATGPYGVTRNLATKGAAKLAPTLLARAVEEMPESGLTKTPGESTPGPSGSSQAGEQTPGLPRGPPLSGESASPSTPSRRATLCSGCTRDLTDPTCRNGLRKRGPRRLTTF